MVLLQRKVKQYGKQGEVLKGIIVFDFDQDLRKEKTEATKGEKTLEIDVQLICQSRCSLKRHDTLLRPGKVTTDVREERVGRVQRGSQ